MTVENNQLNEAGVIGLSKGNNRLYDGPAFPQQNADIAYGFLRPEYLDTLSSPQARYHSLELLPDDHQWHDPVTERQAIPLPLSEFLAYKAALAYLDEPELQLMLRDCCEGIELDEVDPSKVKHFRFFDSAKAKRKIGDTQGFGFLYQGKAYIIMRGTTSGTDWRGNLNDRQTTLLNAKSKELLKLQMAMTDLLKPDGNPLPGRHLGFCLGWAVVRGQIEDWIMTLPQQNEHTFIFSGHSLGGALAFIGAYEFATASDRKVGAVITFGAPIAGGNAFAQSYNAVLGHCTVRFEAEGDSVPRLMQRGYYRFYTRIRQFAQKLFDKRKTTDLPEPVGFGLAFAAQPALSTDDFQSAIATAIREYQEQQREKQVKKEESGQTTGEDESGQTSSDSADTKTADSAAGQSSDSKPASTVDGKTILLIFGAIAFIIISIWGWVFVRRKLASHNIQQRYGLYLSTLSYQRLRQLRAGKLDLANEDLAHYEQFIRGDLSKAPKRALDAVRDLPVRLKPDDQIDYFLSASEKHIV